MRSSVLHRALAGAALSLGLFAAFAGEADPAADAAISPLALAERIRAREAGLLVLDARGEDFDEGLMVAGAQPVAPDSPAQWSIQGAATVVIYGLDGESSLDVWRRARLSSGKPMRWVDGGLAGWTRQVLEPVLPAPQTPADSARTDEIVALSTYFGGRPRIARPGEPIAEAGDAAAMVKRASRRGCGPGF